MLILSFFILGKALESGSKGSGVEVFFRGTHPRPPFPFFSFVFFWGEKQKKKESSLFSCSQKLRLLLHQPPRPLTPLLTSPCPCLQTPSPSQRWTGGRWSSTLTPTQEGFTGTRP